MKSAMRVRSPRPRVTARRHEGGASLQRGRGEREGRRDRKATSTIAPRGESRRRSVQVGRARLCVAEATDIRA